MPDITVGTRVTHRRYSWMVGTVRDHAEGGYLVHWNGSLTNAVVHEYLSDLRATPQQPKGH